MMISPTLNPDEDQRLEALRQYQILDTAPEADFDDIVQLASFICGTPISLISLIDESRQWFKARKGLAFNESSRAIAFCAHTILEDEIMVVEDTHQDARFFDNPFVTEAPNIRFYAGVPLFSPSGHKIGSLCVINDQPQNLKPEQTFALKTLARQVIHLLELRRQVQQSRKLLAQLQQQNQELQRAQDFQRKLQSILGHDLRSPIGAARYFFDFLQDGSLSQEEIPLWAEAVGKSLALSEQLLHNFIQVSKASFYKNGLQKNEIPLYDLAKALLEDMQLSFVIKKNESAIEIDTRLVLHSDAELLKVVLRNLLQNANKYTEKGKIILRARLEGACLCLEVEDNGIGLEPEQLKNLFAAQNIRSQPGTLGEEGSGLGLLICREFAQTLGGRMEAQGTPGQGSIFSLILPYPG
ncbi:MAG: GAF domain-containing sensor histidine kinase [Microscillaceae bacterium]|nr:GAF domain-containing sensor histidine kinase [Microscillaceae bacterium]